MSDFNNDFDLLLDAYLAGPGILKNVIGEIPKPALDFRPTIPGAWTISEHVRHLVDNDFNFVLRAKMSISEPGARVMILDEESWAREAYQVKEDLDDYLDLFDRTRRLFATFLKKVDRHKLQNAWITHPKRGRLDFIDLFQIYARHVEFHLEYLNRNMTEWKKLKT